MHDRGGPLLTSAGAHLHRLRVHGRAIIPFAGGHQASSVAMPHTPPTIRTMPIRSRTSPAPTMR